MKEAEQRDLAHDHLVDLGYAHLTDPRMTRYMSESGDLSSLADQAIEEFIERLDDTAEAVRDNASTCARCGGSGGGAPPMTCPSCGGSGRA